VILISKYLVPTGFTGITIYPFVFLKRKASRNDAVLINHEKIHLKQQLELLVIPFYVLYTIEFFIRLVQHKNWNCAYKNISFEREAYQNQNNTNYLKVRKFWNFLKYIRTHDF